MSIQVTTEHGVIHVSNDSIATIVGVATTECYGIVGMASRQKIKDGVSELLRRENVSKGVVIRQDGENELYVDIHVIVLFGVKISEVARNIQEKVKFTLEKMIGISSEAINVYVEGVRLDEKSKEKDAKEKDSK